MVRNNQRLDRALLLILAISARVVRCYRPCVLRYHSVDSSRSKSSVSPARFAAQMQHLARAGFSVLSLAEVIHRAQADDSRSAGRFVAITFDDGYRTTITEAWPILAAHGFPLTVYIAPHLLGKTMPDTPDLPLMTVADLKEFAAQPGVEIGSHTLTHPDLKAVDVGTARREIAASRAELEVLLGRQVRSFCYPFGHYTEETIEHVRAAGYDSACNTLTGSALRLGNPFEICRLDVDNSMSLAAFAAQLTCATDWRVALRASVRRALDRVGR